MSIEVQIKHGGKIRNERDVLLQRLVEKDAEIERLKGLVKDADRIFMQKIITAEYWRKIDDWLKKAKGVV